MIKHFVLLQMAWNRCGDNSVDDSTYMSSKKSSEMIKHFATEPKATVVAVSSSEMDSAMIKNFVMYWVKREQYEHEAAMIAVKK